MAASTIALTIRDGSITLSDGSLTPKTLSVDVTSGDFACEIPGPTISHYLVRNQIAATPLLRKLDDQPCSGSFSFYVRDLVDSTNPVLEDLLTLGFPKTWSSTNTANDEVPTMDIIFTLDNGEDDSATITFNLCTVTASFVEGDPDVISVSFVSHKSYPTVAQ